MPDKKFTVDQAAQKLGLSSHQVRRRIERGDLNAEIKRSRTCIT